jgi:L-fuculose-phosphate aldolase
MDKHLLEEIKHVSYSMFTKNFFGVYHGSISARVGASGFMINKKDTILDDITPQSLVKLDCHQRDYRWSEASQDVYIHERIYETIANAKYISFTMPPYAVAYSLKHGTVFPQDYHGKKQLGKVIVYNPQSFDDWLQRAPYEIPQFFQKHDSHLLLIKGFGLISYDRDLTEMAKKVSILENSCRLLALSANI